MKKHLITLFILLLSIDAIANSNISIGRDTADTDKTIFSGEFNIYRNTLYNNYSLMHYGKSWKYGAQISNIRLDGERAQSYENDTYFRLAKSFDMGFFGIELGGQVGYNFDSTADKLHAMTYIDGSYQVDDRLSLHFGGYYVNDELATKYQPFNFQSGFKYKFDQVTISGDYYSGSNNLSGGVMNVSYKATPTFRPYIGIIVPEYRSGNEFAGITGFTWKVF